MTNLLPSKTVISQMIENCTDIEDCKELFSYLKEILFQTSATLTEINRKIDLLQEKTNTLFY